MHTSRLSFISTIVLLGTFVGCAGAQQVQLVRAFTGPDFKSPRRLVASGQELYFNDHDLTAGNTPVIFSMPMSGGAPTELYRGQGDVAGFGVIGGDLFWIDPNAGPVTDTVIFRAPRTGGGAVTAIYTGALVGQPIVDGVDLASNGLELFSVDAVQGRLHRLDAQGGGLVQLASRYGGYFDQEHLNRIEWSSGDIYLVDAGGSTPGGVFSPRVEIASALGGGFSALHDGAPLVAPTDLAIGDGFIYMTDSAAGNTIWQMPVTGGAPTALVSGAPFVGIDGIVYHDGSLYVSDNGWYQDPVSGAWINGDGAIYAIDIDGVEILSVLTTATRVRPGQSGVSVAIEVAYSGGSPRSIDQVDLLFRDAAGIDLGDDYSVTPHAGNPAVLQPGATVMLSFDIDVHLAATLGAVTIDASIRTSDLATGIAHTERGAALTASWDVVPCYAVLCGDCNTDGRVDLLDALTAAQAAGALQTLTPQQFSNCNVIGRTEPDPAARIDVLDALMIARHATGLPVTLSCCN